MRHGQSDIVIVTRACCCRRELVADLDTMGVEVTNVIEREGVIEAFCPDEALGMLQKDSRVAYVRRVLSYQVEA